MLGTDVNRAHSGGYHRPASLAEALSQLGDGPAMIVSGCTDVFPVHVGRPLPPRLVDVSRVAEMRGIAVGPHAVRIGGAVTWSEIAKASLPPAFHALQDAARQVGSWQVQNRGTIAGNICNASPAADGVPPLLILDAEVELASPAGSRRLPLADFVVGYRKTALRPNEIVVSVIIPHVPAEARSAFVKLGARKYLVISIVMVAALVVHDGAGRIAAARLAVGSAGERALRLPALESALIGLAAADLVPGFFQPHHFAGLNPIDDVRATAQYRSDAAQLLVADAVRAALGG
jgi:CO/xanthine dehydrogenase FAD-binding subunit